MVTLDRYTAFSAAGGALTGAKGYPLVTALGATVVAELWENYRLNGRIPPDDAAKFAVNVGVAMAAWWAARRVVR